MGNLDKHSDTNSTTPTAVALDVVIKYIRSAAVAGSFSEGCTCELCDKYEKKVRRALIRLSAVGIKPKAKTKPVKNAHPNKNGEG